MQDKGPKEVGSVLTARPCCWASSSWRQAKEFVFR